MPSITQQIKPKESQDQIEDVDLDDEYRVGLTTPAGLDEANVRHPYFPACSTRRGTLLSNDIYL